MAAELSELEAQNEDLRQLLAEKEKVVEALREEIEFWKNRLFGRKSEKLSAFDQSQMQLFNEAEDGAVGVLTAEQAAQYRIGVRGHSRRAGGIRKPLPASLPRRIVIHDIPESEKSCCGRRMQPNGEEPHEELEFIPGRLEVIRHVRLKYLCVDHQGAEGKGGMFKIAPPPPSMIPKGMVAPGLLTELIASKFVDAVPFYRQVKILGRRGIVLARSTICSWAMDVAGRMEVLKTLLWEKVLSGPVIQADETKLQVLDEPGRENTTLSWMWVYCGGDPEHRVVIYEYRPSRAGRVPLESLACYRGKLQTDGYKGYEAIGEREGIEHVGCLAHIRRAFCEADRIAPKTGQAREALQFIRKLYEVESRADELGLSPDERRELRRSDSRPILQSFRQWLEDKGKVAVPGLHLGKAIRYAVGQWDRMIRYVDDGLLQPDNNRAENAIRPFVVGRKNWLFSGSPRGAFASATLYTMIESAKANGLEPYHYLHHVFRHLPEVQTEAELLALLPTNLTPAQIAPRT